jgi:hypothetical protein
MHHLLFSYHPLSILCIWEDGRPCPVAAATKKFGVPNGAKFASQRLEKFATQSVQRTLRRRVRQAPVGEERNETRRENRHSVALGNYFGVFAGTFLRGSRISGNPLRRYRIHPMAESLCSVFSLPSWTPRAPRTVPYCDSLSVGSPLLWNGDLVPWQMHRPQDALKSLRRKRPSFSPRPSKHCARRTKSFGNSLFIYRRSPSGMSLTVHEFRRNSALATSRWVTTCVGLTMILTSP